jgi:hypothetical protein
MMEDLRMEVGNWRIRVVDKGDVGGRCWRVIFMVVDEEPNRTVCKMSMSMSTSI